MKKLGYTRLGNPIYDDGKGSVIEVRKNRLGITSYHDKNGKEFAYYHPRLGEVVKS